MKERKLYEMPTEENRTEYRLVLRNLTEEQAKQMMQIIAEQPDFLRHGELTIKRQTEGDEG